jgi:hypothetical protein
MIKWNKNRVKLTIYVDEKVGLGKHPPYLKIVNNATAEIKHKLK